ncbi:MAG: ABC transporter permease subunit [Clostridia bacterium]|nr:ABC transporter permease subunit [Clostridia bacterium]
MNDIKENAKTKKINIKNVSLRIAGALAFLAVWQIFPLFMGDTSILLATPLQVANRLFELVPQAGFMGRVWFSFARIAAGFGLAFASGILLASLAARYKIAEALIKPYMTVAKTVPVASFIVLALIWLSSSSLSVFISFLMVLPIIYTNVLQGIRSADAKLLETADLFKVPASRRVRYIYIPAAFPYLISGSRVGLGMAWKAGVAAEVISIATGSIGEQLYFSKVYLDSAELLAWTVVVVLLSLAFEKLTLFLLGLAFKGVKKL